MNAKFLKIISVITILLCVLIFVYSILTHVFPRKYSVYVQQYAKEYAIDENLVYAIIKCESNFKSESVSHAGAIGLMQITPATLEWAAFKAGDNISDNNILFNASDNIKYGCCIYSLFFNEFGNNKEALASYNAGRGNVLKWLADKRYSDDGILLKDIPFEETRRYVSKVLNTKRIYDLLY